MGYIGNVSPLTPEVNVYPEIQFFSGNGVTTTFQLTRPVRSVATMIVVVNNVIQKPGDAFSVNTSNQIVFTSVPSAGTNNIYVIYQGTFNTIVTPPIGALTIGDSQLAFNAVTATKIADNAVTATKLATGSVTREKLDVVSTGAGAMQIPQGTTAERPASPQTGMIRFNTTTNLYEFYDGTDWITLGWRPMQATGGVQTSDGTYNYHTFTSGATTFTVTDAGTAQTFEFFAWGGGGGGGGAANSRGGGAGGAVYASLTNVVAGGYTISIGGGGGAAAGGCISGTGGGAGGAGPAGFAAGGRGGNPGGSGCSSPGGGGGGGTLLLLGSTILAAAGGGGGGGGAESGTPAGPGGGGGQNGFNGVGAGGAAGASGSTNGGTIDAGGDQSAGGGGGGGFQGGAAGNPPGSDGNGGGGGGGGSGFFLGVIGTIFNGNGTTPGNESNSFRSGAGAAGGQLASGTGGRAVIRYRIVR
jgi:hypothetical protein